MKYPITDHGIVIDSKTGKAFRQGAVEGSVALWGGNLPVKVDIRMYEKTVTFTAKLWWKEASFNWLLDVKMPPQEFLANQDSAIEACLEQVKAKVAEYDREGTYFDRNNMPYTVKEVELGTIKDAQPGQPERAILRLRFYPKSVRPMLVFQHKPVGSYQGNSHELLEKVQREKFDESNYIGGIKRMLRGRCIYLS